MQRVQRGELDKARLLFDRYQVRMYNYCLQLSGDREASKDLTQEVFYKMLKFRHTYQGTSFSTWLYAIAKNLCYDYHKAQRKAAQQTRAFQTYQEQGREEVAPRGDLNQLNQALRQLSIGDRELIVMHKYQGMKYQEMAAITNASEGTVRTRTHRALQKLKTLYFKNTKQHEL